MFIFIDENERDENENPRPHDFGLQPFGKKVGHKVVARSFTLDDNMNCRGMKRNSGGKI